MEKIICPICSSENICFFCEKNGHKIRVCKNCQAGFVWPMPERIEKIYDESYFIGKEIKKGFGYTDYEKDKKPMEGVFIDYLKELEKLTKGRKIFDFGAATGVFLDLAEKRGWETSGIEISEYAASVARVKGHKVIKGGLAEENILEKYDAVTMWDVLEHLPDPKEILRKINSILNEDGILLINTVNRKSLLAKILGKRWHLMIPPEHLFYFTPASLKILLEKAGFGVIKIKIAGKKFSLAYIFKILYGWQKIKLWKSLSDYFDKNFWRKLFIPINLRDNILIIARKTKDV